jgi:hypothetical protein
MLERLTSVTTTTANESGICEDVSIVVTSIGPEAQVNISALMQAVVAPIVRAVIEGVATNTEFQKLIEEPIPYISPKKVNKKRRMNKERRNEIHGLLMQSFCLPTILQVNIEQLDKN